MNPVTTVNSLTVARGEPAGTASSQPGLVQGRTRRAGGQQRLADKARPGVRGQGQNQRHTRPQFYIPGHYLYALAASPPFQSLTFGSSVCLCVTRDQTACRVTPRRGRSGLPVRRRLGSFFLVAWPDGPTAQAQPEQLVAGGGAVPVGRRRRPRLRGVRPGREGALRRRHLRLRGRCVLCSALHFALCSARARVHLAAGCGRELSCSPHHRAMASCSGVGGRGGDGVHARAGDRERDAARRRHWGHLRRRLLHRGRRGVARPLALGRLRRLDRHQHGTRIH